jgi:TolB-like protein
MSSLIPGYEYDIFISYRQKDNKYDGWVTEFVDYLRKELEAAFKEEISVYFDINPHDGLLETHDVDESLKEKLKCLVFIPIISRTYCDPKSFAWEHEFKAFVERASKDPIGLKVRLTSGNVSGRVLPVLIYDLDEGDIKQCETVLGGVLRGVDFIYAEPGVNRPLKPDDDEKLNLYKTKYRNQINKVGNAIKDLLPAIKAEYIRPAQEDIEQKIPVEKTAREALVEKRTSPARSGRTKILTLIPVFAAVIIATIFLYPRIFKKDRLEKLRSSGEKIVVAVLPFQNMTNDTTLNVWQDGIQDNLINTLSNSEELKVRQTESISVFLNSKGLTNFASITPSLAHSISRNLNTDILISGSIKAAGNALRVNTQLIDSRSNEVYKSFQIDGYSGEILTLIDSLSRMVRNFLVLSKIEKETPMDFRSQNLSSTNSPEAYRYFIYGEKAFIHSDNKTAVKMYTRALEIDSDYVAAAIMLPFAYRNQGMVEEAKKLWTR